MPLDRQPRRILMGSVGVVCLAFAAGCHSTLLQPVASTPPADKLADPVAPVAQAGPAQEVPKVMPTERTQLATAPTQPVQTSKVDPPIPGLPPVSVTATIEPPSEQIFRSDATILGPSPTISKASAEVQPVPVGLVAFQAKPIDFDVQASTLQQDQSNFFPPAATPSATPMIDGLIKRSEQIQKLTVRELGTPDNSQGSADKKIVRAGAQIANMPRKDPELLRAGTDLHDLNPPDRTVTAVARSPKSGRTVATDELLKIVGPRLCRRVVKFGTLDPLPRQSIAPGQRVVLYLELTGVKYDHRSEEYHSRHATRIELFRATGRGSKLGTEPVWVEMLDDADYTSDQRLRDFYLNYVITFPKTLSPGDYLLKLTVTDLVSTRSATSEIRLAVEE